MNYTPNYQLPTWVKTDRIQMETFNDMTAKLDAALTAERAARESTDAALAAASAGHGNCRIYAATYTGTGQYGASHPNTLSFPRRPVLVMIHSNAGYVFSLFQGNPSTMLHGRSDTYYNTVIWSGNMVSWSGGSAYGQMNEKNTTYYVVAFLQMD